MYSDSWLAGSGITSPDELAGILSKQTNWDDERVAALGITSQFSDSNGSGFYVFGNTADVEDYSVAAFLNFNAAVSSPNGMFQLINHDSSGNNSAYAVCVE